MEIIMDQIIAKISHKILPIIKGEPSYQRIHNFWTLLYSKAYNILTRLVGGNHGHIRFFMQDTVYVTISPKTYNIPVDLGGTAQVRGAETTEVCLQLQDNHAESCHIHENHNNMDTELNTMLLEVEDSMYVFALHNDFT